MNFTTRLIQQQNKVENGNGECVKETTTRPLEQTTAKGHAPMGLQRQIMQKHKFVLKFLFLYFHNMGRSLMNNR